MDVFSLAAKITLDTNEYERGLSNASKSTSSFAAKLSGGFDGVSKGFSVLSKSFSAVSSVGEKAAGAVLKSLTALGGASATAATGIGAIGVSAFNAYADYEQLVGGIETLFKSSADTVMKYADNAYKTAGLSANEYMDLTTSFSASLLQSLGNDTAAAAEKSNLAITDMSDNINKMGSTAQSVQDAYRGFAKQNFTMLDNLKLGYGGTKEEMQRLLTDAEAVKAAHGELASYSIDSFADIVDAIHVVQTEMGITGTTAEEASTTIQGSVSSMKGAWDNFMVGIADKNQDMTRLMDNLIDSVVTAGHNVVPRIQEIVEQILRVGPELVRGFAEIIPEFAKMGGEIITTLVNGLKEQGPAIQAAGSKIIGFLADGIIEHFPSMARGVTGIVTGIVNMLGENKDKLIKAGTVIVDSIASGFKDIIKAVKPYISDFIPALLEMFLSYHETLFTVGADILGAIGKGLSENQGQIQTIASDTIGAIVTGITENAPDIIDGAIALLEALVGAISENASALGESAAEIVSYLATSIGEAAPDLIPAAYEAIFQFIQGLTQPESLDGLIDAALDLISGLVEGFENAMPLLLEYAPEIISNIVSKLIEHIPDIFEVGVKLLEGIGKGMLNGLLAIPKIIGAVVEGIINGFKELFGIHSPSTVFAEMGELLIAGLLQGLEMAWEGIVSFFGSVLDGLKTTLSDAWDNIRETASSAWEGITGFLGDTWESISTTAGDIFGHVKDGIGNAWEKVKDTSHSIWEGLTGWLGETWDGLVNASEDSFEGISDSVNTSWTNASDSTTRNWADISGQVIGALETLSAVTEQSSQDISSTVDASWLDISASTDQNWDAIVSATGLKSGQAVDAVDHNFSRMEGTVTSNLNAARSSAMGQDWTSVGENIVDGMSSGVRQRARELANTVANAALSALNAAKAALDINSPSKKAEWLFEMVMRGGEVGVEKNAHLLTDAMENVSADLLGALDPGEFTPSFAPRTAGAAAYSGSGSSPMGGINAPGGMTVNIYSPESVDAVQAARVWKKETQKMSLAYM